MTVDDHLHVFDAWHANHYTAPIAAFRERTGR